MGKRRQDQVNLVPVKLGHAVTNNDRARRSDGSSHEQIPLPGNTQNPDMFRDESKIDPPCAVLVQTHPRPARTGKPSAKTPDQQLRRRFLRVTPPRRCTQFIRRHFLLLPETQQFGPVYCRVRTGRRC